jgi:ABC-2 type transport system permease protein
LTSGALGLTLGCLVRPDQIGLMFGLLVIPLTLLGCISYPWAALGLVRWLQIVVLMNPLVYLSEGVRAALTPTLPHMATVAYLGASIAIAVFLVVFGPNRFVRPKTTRRNLLAQSRQVPAAPAALSPLVDHGRLRL